jgi:hypothetical protein
MIELTRLNGSPLAINCDLIKYAEAAPDTVLTLITGEKLVVLAPPAARSRNAPSTIGSHPSQKHGPRPCLLSTSNLEMTRTDASLIKPVTPPANSQLHP